MKLLLAISLSLFTTAALACTNFSGKYKNEQNEVYTVSQSGCASVTLVSSEGTQTILADGVRRVTEENAEVRVSTAASFIGANLTLNHLLELKVPLPPEVPPTAVPKTILEVYVKDARGNIVQTTTLYNSAGTVLNTMTAVHQKI